MQRCVVWWDVMMCCDVMWYHAIRYDMIRVVPMGDIRQCMWYFPSLLFSWFLFSSPSFSSSSSSRFISYCHPISYSVFTSPFCPHLFSSPPPPPLLFLLSGIEEYQRCSCCLKPPHTRHTTPHDITDITTHNTTPISLTLTLGLLVHCRAV